MDKPTFSRLLSSQKEEVAGKRALVMMLSSNVYVATE